MRPRISRVPSSAEIAVTPPHWPFAHISSEDQTQVLSLIHQAPCEPCPCPSPSQCSQQLVRATRALLSAVSSARAQRALSTFPITSRAMLTSFPSMGDTESIKLNRTLRSITKRCSAKALFIQGARHPTSLRCCQCKSARNQKNAHPMGEE